MNDFKVLMDKPGKIINYLYNVHAL
jgi:hypothetical protein